jgi:hypothetical protein
LISIYGLVCPLSGDIRYIGKTEKSIKRRLVAHLTETRRLSKTSHKRRWIAKCIAQGVTPTVWLLEEVADGVRWQDRERAWIKRATDIGLDLTNQTAGGEGLDFTDPEASAVYRANLAKSSRKVYYENHEMREAFRQGSLRSWSENREERLAALKEATSKPEYKRNLANAMQLAKTKPGYKENRRRVSRHNWEVHRETFMKAFSNPEVKVKQSESKKKTWADPEARNRMMNRWTPEAKAKQAEVIRSPERSAKIQAAMTPEVRARQGAKMKEYWARKRAEKA